MARRSAASARSTPGQVARAVDRTVASASAPAGSTAGNADQGPTRHSATGTTDSEDARKAGVETGRTVRVDCTVAELDSKTCGIKTPGRGAGTCDMLLLGSEGQ